jgi:hypothetical protein
MKASTERKIIRWLHIVLSIPILGYIYGPLAGMPQQAMVVKWIIMPTVILSGFWLWKGHLLRKKLRKSS